MNLSLKAANTQREDHARSILFDNSYAKLPERFYQRVAPTPVPAPELIRVNRELAKRLRIDPDFLTSADGVAILAGNAVAAGSEPIALAYAGHQFGHLVPQLGDGRAVLLGEVVDEHGERFDIQLKGSGRTRFSRRGDGRAALGPVLREYIVSEAMAALGIRTTRSLAAVLIGESVMRERATPGGIVTRVASSHLRVGSFQYFAVQEDIEALRLLADYAINRHYPDAAGAKDPYLAFFDAVIGALAELTARWMLVGFIHGVLNTDNTSIAGETIDYGPCAFMDAYHLDKVFSSIDHHGRYAFGNQPRIIKWNLARFAETLLPLLAGGPDAAIAAANDRLASFNGCYERAYLVGLRKKLGLRTALEGDLQFGQDLLRRMAENQADFTLTFRALSEASADPSHDAETRQLFSNPAAFDQWVKIWRERLAQEDQDPQGRRAAMRAVNPMFIARNHRVEEVIAAAEKGNFQPFDELNTVLQTPYDDQPEFARYAMPPMPLEEVQQTFCGT
jgi:uncharacterized protein YdiU (UPF0061 family)